MEQDYIIHQYGCLNGAIGNKNGIAYVSIGKNVAAIGCYADTGRLDRNNVRQIVKNTGWDEVYIPTSINGYNHQEDGVSKYIIENINILDDIGLVADYVRCYGDFSPIVKIGYTAVPDFAMSGIGYFVVPNYVVNWTREFLASRK